MLSSYNFANLEDIFSEENFHDRGILLKCLDFLSGIIFFFFWGFADLKWRMFQPGVLK